MEIKLLQSTPLEVADTAIAKCYGKEPYTEVEKQQNRINRVANVSKHSSTIEHLVYSFDIDGISRAVLQELARHRIASYTVKSTRYTLQELKKATDEELGNFLIDSLPAGLKIDGVQQLKTLRSVLNDDVPRDYAKYLLPESYKTSLVMTINARALQNFLALRTDSHALWEIQDLARAMFEVLPEDHKFLYNDHVKEQK